LLPRIRAAQAKNLVGFRTGRGLNEQLETRQFTGRIRASRFPRQRQKATRKTAQDPEQKKARRKELWHV
jgi:hypothetical protein